MNPKRDIDCTSQGKNAAVREYLYAEELAKLTPWSVDAIDRMATRGALKHNVHFFQQRRGGRRIFKWSAIVAFIEQGSSSSKTVIQVRRKRPREAVNIEEATEALRRLA